MACGFATRAPSAGENARSSVGPSARYSALHASPKTLSFVSARWDPPPPSLGYPENTINMASLEHLRRQIDRLDGALLELLNKRGRLGQHVGAEEARKNQSVFAPGRERDLLKRLKDQNRGPLTAEAV